MKTRILLMIESDPRQSPRPAEAMRVAAGLLPWGKVEPVLYLHGQALQLLDSSLDAEEWMDGEGLREHLASLAAGGVRFHAQKRQAEPACQAQSGRECPKEIGLDELAALAASCQAVARF